MSRNSVQLPARWRGSASENELGQIGVLGKVLHALADIGGIDRYRLSGLVRGGEADLVEQSLHHRMDTPGADVLDRAIDFGGEPRYFFDRVL